MIRVIVTTHGHLASALVTATTLMVGSTPSLVAVDHDPQEAPDALYARCREAISNASEVVFLVDMLGGSTYNAATRCCMEHPDCDVVTGVNLPMVIDASTRAKQDAGVSVIVGAAMEAAQSSVTALRSGNARS